MSYQTKHFYAYFCLFGPNTNIQWNCRLAMRFSVSRRTIRRWLKKLRELRLIWITSGGGIHRRIHTHYYTNLLGWFTALAAPNLLKNPYKKGKIDISLARERNKQALLLFGDKSRP